MKKKIAAFANGWSDEYLIEALKGVKKSAEEKDADVYLFINYSSADKQDENVQGEVNILNLANLEDYDGVLLFGNTLNNAGELPILSEKIRKLDKPAVCLEYEVDGIDCVCTDNYSGMYELVDHLITEHDVRKIAWVSGISGNKENEERHRAVTECMKKHGLPDDSKYTLQGDWSFYVVQDKLGKWLQQYGLPDAFVCANDVMAMGVMAYLINNGYNLPKDVIVTGFDNLKSTGTFVPALTTVERKWTERSYDAFSHLIDLIDGAPKAGVQSFPSYLLARESCGCRISDEMKREQMSSINKVYTVPIECKLFDWHLSGLDEATTGQFTLEDIHDGLEKFFKDGIAQYEGDTFCICLDEGFVDSIYETGDPRCLGYSEYMHVLYAKRDGNHMPYQKIKTSYIFPVFSKPEERGNVYIIAPIHSSGTVIGYGVFKNYPKILETTFLYSWLRHMRIGLMRGRQNIRMELMNRKLREISILDELTGLLNRMGYEKKAIPMLEETRKAKKNSLMMVVDINKMKMINDRYGHLQGDLAIRLVARAIKDTIPRNWCGIRYGGDEFVLIGENVFVDDGSLLKKQLISSVERLAQELMIPFELSISAGSVSIDPSENISLDEYFRRADNAMYEMKKKNNAERRD